MKMATVDDGRLLKIIYPGGRIDLYDRPVTAREIMNQHPKDLIARTDVFRVPWFVVSPDATLMPGMQFLVVPKYTIKQLLKKHPKSDSSIETRNNTRTVTRTDPVLKESPHPASSRSATVHPNQHNDHESVSDTRSKGVKRSATVHPNQHNDHESVSDTRSKCVKMGCVPLTSQSMDKLKISSQLLVKSLSCKLNNMKLLHVPSFQFPHAQNGHSSTPPPPPQIHPPAQASESSRAARTERRVTFKLPTAEDIKYYIPAHDSPDRDFTNARPVS